METVTRLAERYVGSGSAGPTTAPDLTRSLSVTASYVLSEDGRKASLLAGGNGHAVQQIALQVPASRLHLVSVDKQGVARLKLRPQFTRDGEQVVRIDAAPTYDAPPTIDELYRAAAKNHELEAAYGAERVAHRSKRSEEDRARRDTVAQAFLADTGQRAVAHPPPSPKWCVVVTDSGRILFDVTVDQGAAREVPPEAHRRFRADLRAKEDHRRQDRASQLAVHAEKKRFIADWVAAYGTDEQRVRQAAGMLPIAEAVEGITDQAFAGTGSRPIYSRDGAARLQWFLRDSCGLTDVTVSPRDLTIRSAHAVMATAEQWAVVQDLQRHLPAATVVLREHVLASTSHPDAPPLRVYGILVTMKHGPFTVRREFEVGGSPQGAEVTPAA